MNSILLEPILNISKHKHYYLTQSVQCNTGQTQEINNNNLHYTNYYMLE